MLLHDRSLATGHTMTLVGGMLRAHGWTLGGAPYQIPEPTEASDRFEEGLARSLDWEKELEATMNLVQSWR